MTHVHVSGLAKVLITEDAVSAQNYFKEAESLLTQAGDILGVARARNGLCRALLNEIIQAQHGDNLPDNPILDNPFPDNSFPDNSFPDNRDNPFPDNRVQHDTDIATINHLNRENLLFFFQFQQEDHSGLAQTLGIFASIVASQQEWQKAGVALGMASMLLTMRGELLPHHERGYNDALTALIRANLGDAPLSKAVRQGQSRHWKLLLAQLLQNEEALRPALTSNLHTY